MDNDTIDTSVWLGPQDAVYTVERLAKGDFRMGTDGQVRAVPTTVMTVLHDRQILNDEHIEASRRFMVWRAMLAVALGVDRITKTMKADESRAGQEDDYLALVKIMNAADLRVVTEACDANGAALSSRMQMLWADDRDRYARAIRSLRNTYLDAFDSLADAVKQITGDGK